MADEKVGNHRFTRRAVCGAIALAAAGAALPKRGLASEGERSIAFHHMHTGERLEVYAERFQWKSGLVVKDWRYAVRICNIGTTDDDTNSISDLGGTMAATNTGNLLHLMIKAINRIPNLAMGKPCFYMNRTVFTGLQRIALEKSSSAVTIEPAMTQFGTMQNMLSFQGIPCRLTDARRVPSGAKATPQMRSR